jgi:hypothetical protein
VSHFDNSVKIVNLCIAQPGPSRGTPTLLRLVERVDSMFRRPVSRSRGIGIGLRNSVVETT